MNSKETTKELEDYWSQRYKDQATGWDLGEPSTPIKEYADQLKDKNIKILIPGAGNAYEAEYLYAAGFKNVYILDISALPLAAFQERNPDFPFAHIIQADFFNLENTFDLIIEQTFFCSFPPVDNIREKYSRSMYELLKPNGKLVGLWFDSSYTGDTENRPFGGSKSEYLELFTPYFQINIFEKAYNSVATRAGEELFGIFQKADK